jgi:hypothetical protein
VNKFEKELLDYVKELFQDELKDNSVELEISTPAYAKQQGYTYKGWSIGIRKTRENMRDVRVVIKSPSIELMEEVDDYHIILKRMVEKAKHIIDYPPFPQYISQGVILTTFEGEYVEFISKDKLIEMS